jgi:hypothetical protein
MKALSQRSVAESCRPAAIFTAPLPRSFTACGSPRVADAGRWGHCVILRSIALWSSLTKENGGSVAYVGSFVFFLPLVALFYVFIRYRRTA